MGSRNVDTRNVRSTIRAGISDSPGGGRSTVVISVERAVTIGPAPTHQVVRLHPDEVPTLIELLNTLHASVSPLTLGDGP